MVHSDWLIEAQVEVTYCPNMIIKYQYDENYTLPNICSLLGARDGSVEGDEM
jgi:hypothetical protein